MTQDKQNEVQKVQDENLGNLKVERFDSGVVKLSVGGSSEEFYISVDKLDEVNELVQDDLQGDEE